MRVNSDRDWKIGDLIPPFLSHTWNSETFESLNGFTTSRDLSLSMMRNYLPAEKEAGGRLSPNQLEVLNGEREFVQTPCGSFTWHSHLEEPCIFSLPDWLVFLRSKTIWSMLLTPESFRVYFKADGFELGQALAAVRGCSSTAIPETLAYRRLLKFAKVDSLETDPFLIDRAISSSAGVSVLSPDD